MKSTYPTPLSHTPVVLQVLPALKDGGVEKSAIEMALYIKNQGWTPLVASSGGPKTSLLDDHGIRHIKLPLATKTPWGIVINAFRLLGIIRGEKVTLVHARSRAPAWSAWLAAKMANVPFVTTFHGTHSLKGGKLKYIYNSIMVKGPIVIANSQFIRSHIIDNYHIPSNRIFVAPRGIYENEWNPAQFSQNDRKLIRDELQIKNGIPLLLMVGRITRWKGHDLILDALGEMKDLDWVMAFAGSIDKNSEYGLTLLAQAERLGIADRIRWLGSRSDIAQLLSITTLAISGSTRPEAFGRVAIEAMAMGVPVVATGIGGSVETIFDGETGWLVPPIRQDGDFAAFEPQAMAAKLRWALQNLPQLASMGHASRAHVLNNYTVERCCAAEMQAYKKVLSLHNGQQI